jgi:outer membrane PBP1 activator LpoA protein
MRSINNKHLLFLLILISLHACGPTTPTKPDSSPANPTDKAETLFNTGQYIEAGDEYILLAELPELPAQTRSMYLLNAAHAYSRGNDLNGARTILDNVNEESVLKNIIYSDIFLSLNLPAEALGYINDLSINVISEAQAIRVLENKALAYELLVNPLLATRQRIILHEYLTSARQANNIDKIWQSLSTLNIDVLRRQRLISSGRTKSWLELAIIYQSSFLNPDLFNTQLQTWSQQYPDHPANSSLLVELVLSSNETGFRPNHIALILPFTGPYEPYSKAIREGFLAAWFMASKYKPIVNIYDANSLNITETYLKAVSDGADFIVGPLEKEAILALIESDNLPVPILALNQYSENSDSPDNSQKFEIPQLMQFGLVPEDESRQIANIANEQGYSKALVIAPEGGWGERLFNSFAQEWLDEGNRIVSYVTYRNNQEDFALPVKNLLNVASSENRARMLQQKLNKSIKSETRLREDADMIYLIAEPVEARQLIPQLQFHRASNIPVFSTSYIYSGIKASELDRDVNGVFFTDIPWVIEDENSQIKSLINKNWSADQSPYNRLYALGIDAYEIIPNLKRLSEQRSISYTGETGELFMAGNGLIRRKSSWAKFTNGEPEFINME